MKDLKLIIRILPTRDEIDAKIPPETTALEIIDALIQDDNLSIIGLSPSGEKYGYHLVHKGSGREILSTQTLLEFNVKKGDVLLLVPQLIAG